MPLQRGDIWRTLGPYTLWTIVMDWGAMGAWGRTLGPMGSLRVLDVFVFIMIVGAPETKTIQTRMGLTVMSCPKDLFALAPE